MVLQMSGAIERARVGKVTKKRFIARIVGSYRRYFPERRGEGITWARLDSDLAKAWLAEDALRRNSVEGGVYSRTTIFLSGPMPHPVGDVIYMDEAGVVHVERP